MDEVTYGFGVKPTPAAKPNSTFPNDFEAKPFVSGFKPTIHLDGLTNPLIETKLRRVMQDHQIRMAFDTLRRRQQH